jgi:hypothetical protein
MPYIKKEERQKFIKVLYEVSKNIDNVGELNYVITDLCNKFLAKRDKRYENYNSIIGVLECAKQEFYRRSVTIYEDKKINENGDVY